MCGRTACTLAPSLIARLFGVPPEQCNCDGSHTGGQTSSPSHNIGPGQVSPVLSLQGAASLPAGSDQLDMSDACENKDGPFLQVTNMQWGLVPNTCRNPDRYPHKAHLARAETLTEKRSFKELLVRGRRCVVPVDGFFEWRAVRVPKKQGGTGKANRVPYFFYRPPVEWAGEPSLPPIPLEDGDASPVRQPLLMAGLFDQCKTDDGVVLNTYCVITVPPVPEASFVHDRMPAILTRDQALQWLVEPNIKKALHLLRPFEGPLAWHPCSNAVSLLSNNGSKLLAEDASQLPSGEVQPKGTQSFLPLPSKATSSSCEDSIANNKKRKQSDIEGDLKDEETERPNRRKRQAMA